MFTRVQGWWGWSSCWPSLFWTVQDLSWSSFLSAPWTGWYLDRKTQNENNDVTHSFSLCAAGCYRWRILLWFCLHLVDLLKNCNTEAWPVIININLLVRTLWWGLRCRMLLCLSALCTFCPRCSCRRSRTRSEAKKQHRKQQWLMWCGRRVKNRTQKEKTAVLLHRNSLGYWGNYHVDVSHNYNVAMSSQTIKLTSFFTVKPIDTDTNGNLRECTI